jgi:hypothetical protein
MAICITEKLFSFSTRKDSEMQFLLKTGRAISIDDKTREPDFTVLEGEEKDRATAMKALTEAKSQLITEKSNPSPKQVHVRILRKFIQIVEDILIGAAQVAPILEQGSFVPGATQGASIPKEPPTAEELEKLEKAKQEAQDLNNQQAQSN